MERTKMERAALLANKNMRTFKTAWLWKVRMTAISQPVIRKKGLENIEVAQERQKRQYDAKHCQDNEMYKIGTVITSIGFHKVSCEASLTWSQHTQIYICTKNVLEGSRQLHEIITIV